MLTKDKQILHRGRHNNERDWQDYGECPLNYEVLADLTLVGSPLILRHMSPPATIIVVHPRERRAKCTVQPLRKHSEFTFYKHPRFPLELAGYVRLGLGGPVLSEADRESGLLVLDGTWRWVEPMERLVATIPVRSLPPLVTAYPRSSKVSDNPDGGLATVEAIYAAYRLLGRDTNGLLDHYRWGEAFVEQNADFWPKSPANHDPH